MDQKSNVKAGGDILSGKSETDDVAKATVAKDSSNESISNDELIENCVVEIEKKSSTTCTVLNLVESCIDVLLTSEKEEEMPEKKSDTDETKIKLPQTVKQKYPSRLCVGKPGLAQEPWPKDAKLFQPYEVEQILLPDNANCLAVQAFLKMCNLEFTVEPRPNAEAMSPSGRVPFLKAGAFVVSELEGIVTFVNNKGISLTEKLDPEMKSDMRAYMSLIHSVIEVAELFICWIDKETYDQVTSVRNGSIYPWPLNHIQNRAKKNQVIRKLKVLQWYKKTSAEVFQEVENCCQALSDRLEGKEYFFGSSPTELDALVFGHLFTILTTPLPRNDLANTIRKYPTLLNLIQKIEKQYFKRD